MGSRVALAALAAGSGSNGEAVVVGTGVGIGLAALGVAAGASATPGASSTDPHVDTPLTCSSPLRQQAAETPPALPAIFGELPPSVASARHRPGRRVRPSCRPLPLPAPHRQALLPPHCAPSCQNRASGPRLYRPPGDPLPLHAPTHDPGSGTAEAPARRTRLETQTRSNACPASTPSVCLCRRVGGTMHRRNQPS